MKVREFTPPDASVVDVEARFVKWLTWLQSVNAIYHLDDNPHDIVMTGSGKTLFTKKVADQVDVTVGEFRALLGNDRMWEIFYPIATQDEVFAHLNGEQK